MDFSLPIIKKFDYCTKISNGSGFTYTKENRESAALIFTLRGKIRFSNKFGEVTADPTTPIYIPQGTSYVNHCIEDAESIMFCFYCDSHDDKITPLAAFDKKEITNTYERICSVYAFDTPQSNATALSLIYSLFAKLLDTECKNSILSPALEVISRYFDSPDLSLDMLARECNISKPYLHKLFVKELSLSPYQYILSLRMKKAAELLREGFTVSKVSRLVGYSDIYQFSRAFKRTYGISPERYKKRR